MLRILVPILVLTVAVACRGDSPEETPAIVIEESSPSCQYVLQRGEDSSVTVDFPAGLYPAAITDLGSVIEVSLQDPLTPADDILLTVPQCKAAEARQTIEALQEADRQQAEAGIAFEDRRYP